MCKGERGPITLHLRSSISALATGLRAGRYPSLQTQFGGGEINRCSERSGHWPRLHSWGLTNLNLTGGYISAGVVPDVGLGWEVPGGSKRPSSELGGVWLVPPSSTGLVRLEEEDVGLLWLSGAPGGSELRLGTSQ